LIRLKKAKIEDETFSAISKARFEEDIELTPDVDIYSVF